MNCKVVFGLFACFLCSCSEPERCLLDKPPLETGWEKLIAFSDSNDRNYSIKSNSGITEQVRSWSSLTTRFISNQKDQGSKQCFEIRANKIHSYFGLKSFEAYFVYDIERKEDHIDFKFKQRISLHSLDEASYTINLTTKETSSNQYDFAYYKEIDIQSDAQVAITMLDSLVGIDKTYRNLVVFTNPLFKNSRIPASCVTHLVLDSLHGVVQFTTNDGEVWNIDY